MEFKKEKTLVVTCLFIVIVWESLDFKTFCNVQMMTDFLRQTLHLVKILRFTDMISHSFVSF